MSETDQAEGSSLRELHDSRLTRIDFGNGTVVLHFLFPSGERSVLTLSGVRHLLANGLAEANIVLDVSVESGTQIESNYLERMLTGATPSQREYRDEMTRLLRQGGLILFRLNPSYGGEITAICESLVRRDELNAIH